MKRLFIFFISCVNILTLWAHDFEVDGIYYNITSSEDRTVEVTYKGTSYQNWGNEYTGNIIIPSYVINEGIKYLVKNIGAWAFGECQYVEAVQLPDGIVNIGEAAFYRCSKLKTVNIPDGVVNIERWAFSSCGSLKTINIPNSVANIGRATFSNCI